MKYSPTKLMRRELGQVTLLLGLMLSQLKKGDRSLRSFGPIVWNTMLPDNLKECESLDEFKSSIKSWTPDNCVCELCKTYVDGLGYTNISD